jgi:hypothetical protein
VRLCLPVSTIQYLHVLLAHWWLSFAVCLDILVLHPMELLLQACRVFSPYAKGPSDGFLKQLSLLI